MSQGHETPAAAAAAQRALRFASHASAALLLLLFAWEADRSAAHKSPTFDETSHLVAGLSYWHTWDFRLNPESGMFPQLWAALPLWLGGAVPPDFSGEAWRLADDWRLGREFLYRVGNDADTVLRQARRMIVALAVALGALVYLWSLRLFGPGGALVSLWLYAFCPNVLAHARLVTADIAVAFAFPLALAANWACMRRIDPLRLVGAAFATGLLCLAKFAALLLAPMLLLLVVVRVGSPRPPVLAMGAPFPLEERGPRTAVLLGVLCWVAVGAALVVWAAYGMSFRASGAAPLDWARVEALGGLPSALILWARDHRVLPEPWLFGLGYTLETTGERVAFAAGHWGDRGWWWYFPFAAAAKTPIGTLAVLASAAGVAWGGRGRGVGRSRWQRLERSAPVVVLLGVYGASSLAAHVNIGLRHLLPVYGASMILAGAAARAAQWRRWAVLGLLLAATAVESRSVAPDYLAFFNRLAGGPARGYRLLIDSNLDWGQDLPGLSRWLARESAGAGASRCFFSYFGSALPEEHGVHCTRLPGFFDFPRPRHRGPLQPGIYAVSATMLQMLHVPLDVRGEWTAEHEARLRSLQARRVLAERRVPGVWTPLHEAYERHRFARLAAWLRGREPDDQVGGSILLYRLDSEELEAALEGPLP